MRLSIRVSISPRLRIPPSSAIIAGVFRMRAKTGLSASRQALRTRRSVSIGKLGPGDLGLRIGHLIAFDHRGAGGNGAIPAPDIGIFLEIDPLPLEAGDPREGRDIDDRIFAAHILLALEQTVEHAIE